MVRDGGTGLDRHRRRADGRPRIRIDVRRAGDDAARPRGTEQVEPRHAVLASGAVEKQQGIVEAADPVAVHREKRPGKWLEPDRGRQDHTGQPHPAGRGVQELGLLARAQLRGLAGGGQQHDRLDVRPERSRGRVVLAVNVRGERPADRDVLGAGDDGEYPPGRLQRRQQPAQGHTCLRDHHTAVGVHLEDVKCGGVDHDTTMALRCVTVAAPHAARDGPAAPAAQSHVQLRRSTPCRSQVRRPDGRHRRRTDPAPSGDHGGARRGRRSGAGDRCAISQPH